MTVPANALRGTVTAPPEVAGVFPVGDAACVTDPMYGRGLSLALAHAFRLAELLDGTPEVGGARAAGAARIAEELLRPWYEQTVADTSARTALWRARAAGTEPAVPPVAPVPGRPQLAAVAAAATVDAVVWRGLTRMLMTLDTPAAVFDDPGFRERVAAAAGAARPAGPPPPSRAELVAALSRTATAVAAATGTEGG
ncbi:MULTISPECIES: hypothetical protein [Streptomycetaceae]|nr:MULTISPECIES: hypothetical protein [Streptomycetaceae]MYS58847.1 hypothetical protein [Streptomyces sp. SID5468]CCB74541.1 conserved protein of unknown function [Streptantibioticus cattleyicolor NRRL 8057 = DSM 46488]